jgi:streptogramin lyase
MLKSHNWFDPEEKRMKKLSLIIFMSLALVACSAKESSKSVQGVTPGLLTGVVNDGQSKPLNGVMVRVTNETSGISQSVFTDEQGRYELSTGLTGDVTVRFRLPYYRDETSKLILTAGKSVEQKAVLKPMTDLAEISESLPSAYHFGNLAFDKDPKSINSYQHLQRDCAGCHALGNSVTRAPRPLDQWVDIVTIMQSYLGNPDPKLIKSRAALLYAGFNGQAPTVRPVFPVDAETQQAVIHEYRLENTIFPHDADINPANGLVYTVDRTASQMAVTDLVSGKSVFFDQPPSMRPAVGKGDSYSARSKEPGPHSLALGKNGYWYTTNAGSDEIGVFDPKTRTWKASFVLPEPARYPHTIRIGRDGIVWFTLAASTQVGRLDPVSGDIKLIYLPKLKPLGGSAGTVPYGIDISPVDGRIWYARLWGDKLGAIDPTTFAVTEFDSPVEGPRRLRFDAKGKLWVTGYNDGMIAKVDTQSMKSEVYPMPEFAAGYRPAPYALAIHPATQEVWINETLTDRVYRFLPKEKRFIVYPMPLRGTFTRDFTFTASGWACTTNSPILNAALEGNETEVLCIDPSGAKARK